MEEPLDKQYFKTVTEHHPIDRLEIALYEILRDWSRKYPYQVKKTDGLPVGVAEYKFYFKDKDSISGEYVGLIRLTKIAPAETKVEEHCFTTDDEQKVFFEFIEHWIAHTKKFESLEKVIRKNRNNPENPNHGKPGRPHYPEDLWAWRQVHNAQRDQEDVYEEWRNLDAVKKRNLVDPIRQFKRIMAWKKWKIDGD